MSIVGLCVYMCVYAGVCVHACVCVLVHECGLV